MPFDGSPIEQMAGDILPNRTLRQQIASGFNRCNMTTNEGGVINEEYLVLYVPAIGPKLRPKCGWANRWLRGCATTTSSIRFHRRSFTSSRRSSITHRKRRWMAM